MRGVDPHRWQSGKFWSLPQVEEAFAELPHHLLCPPLICDKVTQLYSRFLKWIPANFWCFFWCQGIFFGVLIYFLFSFFFFFSLTSLFPV